MALPLSRERPQSRPNVARARNAVLGWFFGIWGLYLPFSLINTGALHAATDPRIVERYRQMLAANPADESALDRLWKIAQQDGFADDLLSNYGKPAGKNDFAGQLILGGLLHRAGRDDESSQAFFRAAKLDPKSPLPHLMPARFLPAAQAAPELEKAILLLEKPGVHAPAGCPAVFELVLQLAEARIAAGEPEKAVEAWEHAVTLSADALEPRRRLAAYYLEKGNSVAAAAHLAWLEKHGDIPTRVNALRSLARLHQASGAFDPALDALNQALALTAADNWLRNELVAETIRVSRSANRLTQLETRWRKEAETNSHAPGPWLQLADLYSQQGNSGVERVALEKAAALLPADSVLRIRLGRLLVRMDDLPAAAVQLDAALAAATAFGRTSPDLVFERAELDLRRGDPAAARARIDALPASAANDPLTARVVEFYRRNRMFDAIEQRLQKPGADPVALADFFFTQNRRQEARAALRKLIRPDDPPKTQAEAHERVAELLKQAGESVAALAELREAARLQPDVRHIQLVLGDAIHAAGEPKLAPGTAGRSAREVYEKAVALSHTEEDRAEADQRILRSLEREMQPDAAAEATTAPDDAPASSRNHALAAFIESLEARAMKSTGTDGALDWLRLARWQFWNHDPETAQAAISQAVALAPDLPAPHELAVTIALATGDRNGAIAQLRQLAQAVPERRTRYLRQVAHVEMQAGRRADALKILEELAMGQDPDALAELADAQQQADRWKDALASWERLYDTAKKERRHEYLPQLVHAMQHQQLHQRAAEIVWKAFTDEPEPARSEALRTLIAHCREHGLTAWLLEKLQTRAALSGDSGDALALAEALKADGRFGEASRQLEGAARSAPDPAGAEANLVREAEARRNFIDAAAHQRLRLNMIESPSVAEWQKLADLLQQALDYPGADAACDEIVRRFPRDSDALLGCARHFAKWGRTGRALEIVRAVRGFDPVNVRAAAALSRLLADIRPVTPAILREAADAAETVLAKTPGGIASSSLILPPLPAASASRVQSYLATFAAAGDGAGGAVALFDEHAADSEREWRLEAIRRLAGRTDAASRQHWIVQWQDAPAASERLWALYYSGARREAFAFLADLAAHAPGNANRRFALVWCALRCGAWKELGDWIWRPERTPDDHEMFLAALGEWCGMRAEGQVDPDLPQVRQTADGLDVLFAKAAPAQLWPCTRVFANHRRYPQAIALGHRAFDRLPTPRAAQALALGQTLLASGELEEGRKLLQIAATEPADSPDAPPYAALRALFLLTPETERAAWVKKTVATLPGDKPAHAAFATALLSALSGNDAATHSELDRLVTLRLASTSDSANAQRACMLLLAAGKQFQFWHLDNAAAYLWQHALSEIAAQPAAALAGEMRLRAKAVELACATRREAAERIAGLVADLPTNDLIQLAGYLLEQHYPATAARLLAEAQKTDAKTPLPLLLAACAASGDKASAERAIDHWLAKCPDDIPSAQAVLEFLCGFDTDRAAEFAAKVLEQEPADPRILEPLARLQRKLKQWTAAETTMAKLVGDQPGNLQWRILLADLHADSGKPKAAVEILAAAPRRLPELTARTAECLARTGGLVEARIAAGEVLAERTMLPAAATGETADSSVFQRIAAAFDARGEKADALAVLAAAVESASEARQPRAAFVLQRQLLQMLGPAAESAKTEAAIPSVPTAAAELRLRWLTRWKVLAAGIPEFLSAYYELTANPRWLSQDRRKAELLADWGDGRGSPVAGAWIAADIVEARPTFPASALDSTLPALLTRNDVPDSLLAWLDDRCKKADRRLVGIQITEALLKRSPVDPEFIIRHVRNFPGIQRSGDPALRRKGTRKGDAAALLEHAALCNVFTPDAAGRLGLTAVDCATPAVARSLLESAIRADPAAQQTAVVLACVRLLLDARDFRTAKELLTHAYRNPSARDPQPIVDYLRRCGRATADELPAMELQEDLARQVQESFQKPSAP